MEFYKCYSASTVLNPTTNTPNNAAEIVIIVSQTKINTPLSTILFSIFILPKILEFNKSSVQSNAIVFVCFFLNEVLFLKLFSHFNLTFHYTIYSPINVLNPTINTSATPVANRAIPRKVSAVIILILIECRML